MQLNQLNHLTDIDRYHSMNKAAENTFVSQQSISAAILQLEEESQTKLVQRTNKGSYLTEAGRKLVDATQEFYFKCDALKESFRQNSVTTQLHLLLEYSQLATWNMLYLYYSNHFPYIELMHNLFDYIELEDMLKKYSDSIAVTFLHNEFLEKFTRKFHCKIIHTFRLSLLVPKISPLAQNKTISINSLCQMKILFYTRKEKPSALFFLQQKYHLEANGNKYIYQTTATFQRKLAEHADVVCFAPERFLMHADAINDVPTTMVAIEIKENLQLHLCCISKRTVIPDDLLSALETF